MDDRELQDRPRRLNTSNFATPGQQRYLRACMVCSIVMTLQVGANPVRATCPSG